MEASGIVRVKGLRCAISLALCLLGAMALGPVGGARADAPPEFWTKCPTGSGAGQCVLPRGIAVDPASGNFYVSNQGIDRINEFTAWGEFVKAWGWGVADGSPELQTCGPEASPPTPACQAGLKDGGSGQLSRPQGVALDSSGNIYVVDFSNKRVQKFSPDGDFLLMFGGDVNKTKVEELGSTEAEQNLCTAASGDECQTGITGIGNGQFGTWQGGSYIAFNPTDSTIYVGDQARVQKFDTNGSYVGDLPDPEGIIAAGGAVQSLAVDSTGNVYLSFFLSELVGSKPNVHKLSAGGVSLCTMSVGNPRAITLGVGTGAYVVDTTGGAFPVSKVRKFNANSCAEDLSFAPLEGFDASTGIATSMACNFEEESIYVSNTDQANSFVRAYGEIPDPEVCEPEEVPPTISSQYAASVGTTGATLRAQINPHFWSGPILGPTTYYVQYGTAACVEGGWESPCVEEQPTPPGATLNAEAVDKDVTTAGVFLAGLSPDTAYRYRFVAQSPGGGPVKGVGGEVGVDGTDGAFTTFPLPAAPPSPDPCPNAEFRKGAAAHLPDCRAHEMVSPVDKNNGDIATLGTVLAPPYPASLEQSSLDGEKVTYSSATAFADALSAPWTSQYIATREAGEAWSTHAISPPRESESLSEFPNLRFDLEFKAFSEDLCQAWLIHDTDPPLAPGAIEGFPNLYRRDNCGASADGYEAISTVLPPEQAAANYKLEVQGTSADGTHTFFVANDRLTPDAAPLAPKFQLYEATGGALRYVCVLPNGEPSGVACSAGTAQNPGNSRNNTVARAVSEDGSRVFWTIPTVQTSGVGPGALYVRIDGTETIAVSEASARFWTAATDGSKAIYTVDDDLFEFDVDSETETPIANGAIGVAGASEDASRIYFASTEELGGEGEAGKPNLYLYEPGEGGEGTTAYIATLAADDMGQSPLSMVSANPMLRALRVSPDGSHLAFTSHASLTGYDNTDAESGEADAEVFLYEAESEELACISCNPTGARPSGSDYKVSVEAQGFWTAAHIPPWTTQLYAPRALSDDGQRLFFESFDRLVPRDANGAQDVYEWERADSAKACEELGAELFVEDAGGCLSLISSGESPADSEFADASPDGRDVFFRTLSGLVPQDPGLIDLYDARELGGLPSPPVPEPPCEGEACQSPPPPPEETTPSSSTHEGPGNVEERSTKPRRCPKGKRKVRRAGKQRCVPKRKQRSHRKGRAGR